jgi:hypothetical protein
MYWMGLHQPSVQEVYISSTFGVSTWSAYSPAYCAVCSAGHMAMPDGTSAMCIDGHMLTPEQQMMLQQHHAAMAAAAAAAAAAGHC